MDQVAGAVVRSATNHTVGALMRGHGLVGVIVNAIVLILGVWAVKRGLRPLAIVVTCTAQACLWLLRHQAAQLEPVPLSILPFPWLEA